MDRVERPDAVVNRALEQARLVADRYHPGTQPSDPPTLGQEARIQRGVLGVAANELAERQIYGQRVDRPIGQWEGGGVPWLQLDVYQSGRRDVRRAQSSASGALSQPIRRPGRPECRPLDQQRPGAAAEVEVHVLG